MNEADLVARSLAGDSSAEPCKDELVRRHARRIRALCWSRLPHNGPVEDMVQETFLRAFRLLPQLERRESFGSFLSGIAVRVCADWRKARARSEVSLDAADVADREGAPDDGDRLARAIHALPEIYRDTIALFYFADRSYREIAAALDITEAAVNARLAVARRMLRESLTEGSTP